MSLRPEIRAALAALPAGGALNAEQLLPRCPSAKSLGMLRNNLRGLAFKGWVRRADLGAGKARYALGVWPTEPARARRACKPPRVKDYHTRNRSVQRIVQEGRMSPRAFWRYVGSL